MDYPIKLPPLAEIKAKALAALEAGELQCQQPRFRVRGGCSYTGPCAIGAAVPLEERISMQFTFGGGTIEYLICEGIVEPAHDDDVDILQGIQNTHDSGDTAALRALLST